MYLAHHELKIVLQITMIIKGDYPFAGYLKLTRESATQHTLPMIVARD
jgi:hypothetical protein